MGKIRSVKSLSGNKITHFDENGNKIGVSIKSISGRQVTHFDANYNKTGTSFRNTSGRMSHYDSDWNKTGYSQIMNPGQTRHFDTNYNKTGESNRNFWGVHETNRQQYSSSNESASDTAYGCLGMIIVALLIILFLAFCIC